jgi:hypothetical protein
MKQNSMRRITPDAAKEHWTQQHRLSETQCLHVQRGQNCGNRNWVEINIDKYMFMILI